ncbi:hypothetical protein MACJ_000674 [Theileria orientalis]|uniref:mTERF domain-containing protein 1, mitochondrial n=1 Tax=Theileria orientalis TaxID=68886 RepID=A0A976M4H9_THEOR|nr:hypothetical protein MACJ_000674 [Theileria orientalis]
MIFLSEIITLQVLVLAISTHTLTNKGSLLFISHLSPNIRKNRNDLSCNIFFGSKSISLDTQEYKKGDEWHEYFKKVDDSTDTSGLPLAPENEDDPLEEVEDEGDLSKPPTPKKDWYLKKLAHGRRFWHKFFATPSDQTLRAMRWCKFQHDRFHCNRILERTYNQLPLIEPRKGPDGKLMKLTKEEKVYNRHSLRVKRKILGYDNTSEESNLLIIANHPQERLVKLVEKLRMPGVLDLRNYELLRLLKSSMLYLAKPNTFMSTVDFLLCFGRFNTGYSEEFKKYMEIEEKPKKRFRPMVYAIIGKLRNDPFKKELLLPRKNKAPPIREEFPVYNGPESVLNRFLDSCENLTTFKVTTTPYNFDETMDRSFSDIFDRAPEYTTKGSINKLDSPALVEYQKEMSKCMRPEKDYEKEDFVGWTPEDVKNMLRVSSKMGLVRTETIIRRLRSLHNDLGLSYEEIIDLGKNHPRVLKYGRYKQKCLRLYDIDETFTHEVVNRLVRGYPNILTYNVDRCIRPKILYLLRNMGKSVEDLLDYPRYLSFSLYDRIVPRHFAVMNRHYKGEFLSVYRFLFETGFYRSYGQPVTHEKIPDLLPENHDKYMESYRQLSSQIDLRALLKTGDAKFCEIFKLSYRELVEGKHNAFKIPLPTNIHSRWSCAPTYRFSSGRSAEAAGPVKKVSKTATHSNV